MSALADSFAHCEALVRAQDHDRWLATLFAPADRRPGLHALYAFNIEVARVREVITSSLAGEVRLQWWHDAISGEARGDARANPVADALLTTIEADRLPHSAFLAMIEARRFDLYDDLMPTLTDLEGYCGETASALIRLASLSLARGADPGGAAAAGLAGVAMGLAGLVRAVPFHARQGRVYLPADLLTRHDLDRSDIARGAGVESLRAALATLRALARQRWHDARAAMNGLDPVILPAFLSAALTGAYLDRADSLAGDPYGSVIELPQWRKQWILWRAARRGRI